MHLVFQIRVQLYDGGSPPKWSNATATIIVNVARNKFAPRFVNSPYMATIRRDLGYGNGVTQVKAYDNDTEVCQLLLTVIYFVIYLARVFRKSRQVRPIN